MASTENVPRFLLRLRLLITKVISIMIYKDKELGCVYKKIPFYDVLYSLVVTFLLSHHLTMILIISTMAVFYIIFMVRVGNQGAI